MNNIIDRGIIKWRPFDSGFNASEIINTLKIDKSKSKYPTLSEDQLSNLEEHIKEAYYLKNIISLYYYYDGFIKVLNGKINYIDFNNKTLYLNNNPIHFKQILDIKEN